MIRTNDWFVFYASPEYGQRTVIYDAPNKVDPTVNSYVTWDAMANEYLYQYFEFQME